MNRDLFLAILSMDSYNRGYGVNISGLNESGKIGNASIRAFKIGEKEGWESAGFYAIAYELPVGYIDGLTGTVISYRGTNFDTGDDQTSFFNSLLWRDAISGWSVGAGLAGAQALLALDFYQAVASDSVDLRYANVTTTGHSLGGGLAGLTANVYNRQAVLYDHMTYRSISSSVYSTAQNSQAVRDRFYNGQYPWELNASGISAFATEGEVLSYLRGSIFSGDTSATPVQSHSGFGILRTVDLHSMSMLVSLIWAQDNAATIGTTWQSAGSNLWNAFLDLEVAKAVTGVADRKGAADEAGVMAAAIAYSAVDEGERPFGDTAIWSMFNDAGELGQVLAGDEASFFNQRIQLLSGSLLTGLGVTYDPKDIKQYLADVLVQYAGALALYDIEGRSVAGVETHEGVLGLSDDKTVLALDVSSKLWGEVLKSTQEGREAITGEKLDPVKFDTFRKAYFKQAAETDGSWSTFIARLKGAVGIDFNPDELTELVKLGWGKVWGAGIGADNVDRYHMAARNGLANVTLDERSYAVPTVAGGDAKLHIDVYIGQAGNETITGTKGNDLIIGGGGADVVRGGDGDDVVGGGDGDDSLSGGKGNDFIVGGTGKDTYSLSGEGVGGGLNAVLSLEEHAGGANYPVVGKLEISNGAGESETNRFADVEIVQFTTAAFAADNDNQPRAWREATFRFVQGEAA
jgi:RTX calcium-binding nonapeptide repeat (4 copies)